MAPSPREVFDDPLSFWADLTASSDARFEGQNFERKEVCRAGANGSVSKTALNAFRTEEMAGTISGFANTNHIGGLLVLGISSNGEVKGLGHLNEEQRNAVTRVDQLLVNQDAEVKLFDCQTSDGRNDSICLIFVPYQPAAICETIARPARAWRRQGPQDCLLTDAQKEQLRRDKHIVDFEHSMCAPFDAAALDSGVLHEFRQSRLAEAHYNRTDEELLYEAGAIVRNREGHDFTKAGCLFFASNPQRILSYSYIRLLRFDVPVADRDQRGLPTFERNFTGPLTKQIRDVRTFLQESAFFKTYQRRNSDGGFAEEPELPFIAVDEAIVNAVAHRDYGIQLPIQCEKYTDGFVVTSPGSILQPVDIPASFSLDSTRLQHMPRNPTLLEWLKSLKDARGAAFVRALSEGTRRMRDEMAKLGLPAPLYKVTDSQTTVILYSNAQQREADLKAAAGEETTEFVNLYPIRVVGGEEGQSREQAAQKRHDILRALQAKLETDNWYADRIAFGRLTAHRRGSAISVPGDVADILSLFPAYTFQVREYWDRTYLVVDYALTVQSLLSVTAVLRYMSSERLLGITAIAKWKGWQRGKIVAADEEWCRIWLFDYSTEERVASRQVIPRLPRRLLDEVLGQARVTFDLSREIKRSSLALQPNASRERADKTQATVGDLVANIFPLSVGNSRVELNPRPLPLSRRGDGQRALRVDILEEPEVEFSHHHASSDIREGITKFGSYDDRPRDIELVPVCTPELRDQMRSLIERLRGGKFKYKGAERTFSTRLTYSSIITADVGAIQSECARLIEHHPEWVGNVGHERVFLVYSPEAGYALDDEKSPYYETKRLLLESGIPCQMVDTPTLLNPDFKDLNLALNIAAKAGTAPWVLPESIPDADFFVGLSYTQSSRSASERFMGFANVFNEYGRWEFYSGSTSTFAYEDRIEAYERLIFDTLSRLQLPETPSICFHYSAKFSRDDRSAILRAARRVRPQGRYMFVWINKDHNVRLYDSSPETDGSLSRGSYVIASNNQIYLSTTGSNPYRKVLGTPHALEINVHTEVPVGATRGPVDLRAVATQILSLTKLNWASTDSLSAEPITTKYAGDIAYLTAAFMRQGREFRLHPSLERTPWFI